MSAQKRLALVERQNTLDDWEQSGGEWVLRCREWVEILPLTSRELVDAQQTQHDLTHRLKMHWVAGIAAKDRVKFALDTPVLPDDPTNDQNFRIFQIQSVINFREQNKQLELLVVERG